MKLHDFLPNILVTGYNGHPGAEPTGRCREVSIRVESINVVLSWDKVAWPLCRGGRCREVAISDSIVY